MSILNRGGIALLMLLCAGCNLNQTRVAALPVDRTTTPDASTPRTTRTPIPFGVTTLPTLIPLPDGSSISVNTPQPTLISATSAPPLNTMCQVYTTYSGADPRNSLSLRTSAKITAPQVFRVPTGAQVLLVPNTQETSGDDYHWLYVIYVDKETRYVGWMARDSFSTNGVRDPSVATLRPIGATSAC